MILTKLKKPRRKLRFGGVHERAEFAPYRLGAIPMPSRRRISASRIWRPWRTWPSAANWMRCSSRTVPPFRAAAVSMAASRSMCAAARQAHIEPVSAIAALAAITTHVGLISTCTTSYNEPYNLARRFLTIDHISGGRAGWKPRHPRRPRTRR